MLDNLHFNHPYFLWALIPLALVLWRTVWSVATVDAWEKVIDPRLLSFLLQGKQGAGRDWAKWVLALGWLLSVIALADPVWEKIPRPIFQTNTARVIVLDLSNSMLIDDLNPSRLMRARFKIEDILSTEEEGQIGLVVFAGDAFTASPLARDPDTIRSLLQVLEPQIMPVQGSRVDLGLAKAQGLLEQANISHGQILLIADGISEQKQAQAVAKKISEAGHTISVLGVGTDAGGDLNFRTGQTVTVTLETDKLKQIAQLGGGEYHQITSSDADLNAVVLKPVSGENQAAVLAADLNAEDWKSTGPYLLFLLLPFAALAFRKGWLLQLMLTTSLISVMAAPQPAMAADWQKTLSTQWEKLWHNQEQRADKAFEHKQYNDTIILSDDPLKRGTAAYKNEEYQAALDNFSQQESAAAHYNAGNALVKMQQYQKAIEAYDKALAIDPNMADAIANKKLAEALLKQQPQDEKQQSEDGEESDPSEEQKGDKGEPSDDQKSSEQGEESEEGEQGEKGEQGSDNQFDDANKEMDKSEQGEEEQADKSTEDDAEKEQAEQAQQDEAGDETEGESVDSTGAAVEAEDLSEEEKLAAEQWLRRIPDDPGGLLRRKFLWQYQQHNGNEPPTGNPW